VVRWGGLIGDNWDEMFGGATKTDDDWLAWVFEVCCIWFQGWMYLLMRGLIGCCFRFRKHRGNGTLVDDHLETCSIFQVEPQNNSRNDSDDGNQSVEPK
jgi:hypothetical protein